MVTAVFVADYSFLISIFDIEGYVQLSSTQYSALRFDPCFTDFILLIMLSNTEWENISLQFQPVFP